MVYKLSPSPLGLYGFQLATPHATLHTPLHQGWLGVTCIERPDGGSYQSFLTSRSSDIISNCAIARDVSLIARAQHKSVHAVPERRSRNRNISRRRVNHMASPPKIVATDSRANSSSMLAWRDFQRLSTD